MKPYDHFELKFASALVGLLELWMAAIVALAEGRDPLSVALRRAEAAEASAAVMAALAVMTVVGSVRPLRAVRHWGLAGTIMVSAYLLVLTVMSRGIVGMTAGALLLLFTGSFVLLGADAVKGREYRHREGR